MEKITDLFKALFHQPQKEVPATAAPARRNTNEKQHFEIRSTEDARTLFLSLGYANDILIKRNCDAETVAAFKKYADSTLMRQWLAEKCTSQLQTIAEGDTVEYHDIIRQILEAAKYWGIDFIDRELLLKAWEVLWKKEMPTPWLIAQMRFYLPRISTADVPLSDWMAHALSYLQEHFPEDYEKARYGDFLYEFKEEAAELYGRTLEGTEMQCDSVRLVPMTAELTDTIFQHYSEKYNGNAAALREVLCHLNCTFGADDGTLFLTGCSAPAQSYSHQSWDHHRFLVVIHAAGIQEEVECKRGITDGVFRVYCCPDVLLPYADAISDAATCYRNRPARKAFEQEMTQNLPDYRLCNAMSEDHERLIARIPSCFGYLKERIAGNPLEKLLSMLIGLCEQYAPEYGIHNTTFGEPATEEEFAQWEAQHGCTLPEDLKDFLRFANGAELPFCSANFFSLDRFGLYDDCMEEGYISIGDAIGDGTTLCFRKADGMVCVADHEDPDIWECGMDGLLEWIMEFAE